MAAEDDVAGLDVAVHHAPAVGIFDGVADVDEPPQQPAEFQHPAAGVLLQRPVAVEPVDRLLERVAADEPHGVVGSAVVVGAEAVDRDDSRVLQPSRDLGLDEEPLAADGVVGVAVEDPLDRHFPVELAVQAHEHRAQTALRMRPEDAESPAFVRSRHADASGPLGIDLRRRAPAEEAHRLLDLRAAGPREGVADGSGDGDRGEATLRVIPVRREMLGGERFEERSAGRVQVAPVHEEIRHRPTRRRPNGERRRELVPVDHPVLQGEQAEEEVAARVVSTRHGYPRFAGGRSTGGSNPNGRGARDRSASSAYHDARNQSRGRSEGRLRDRPARPRALDQAAETPRARSSCLATADQTRSAVSSVMHSSRGHVLT